MSKKGDENRRDDREAEGEVVCWVMGLLCECDDAVCEEENGGWWGGLRMYCCGSIMCERPGDDELMASADSMESGVMVSDLLNSTSCGGKR